MIPLACRRRNSRPVSSLRRGAGSMPCWRRIRQTVLGATDCFGQRGRAWLAGLELPIDERLTLDGCLRQIDFLDGEIRGLEAALAAEAPGSPEILRLMTVPGVSLHTAAAFMASVGEIRRFDSARQLV